VLSLSADKGNYTNKDTKITEVPEVYGIISAMWNYPHPDYGYVLVTINKGTDVARIGLCGNPAFGS
jgi:hypothetical protein